MDKVFENQNNISPNALALNGLRVEQTMTTPTRPGKKPRPVWNVIGNTLGLEPFFSEIGGRKFRGVWSFFTDPTEAISNELEAHGRKTYSEVVEYRLERKEKRAERYDSYAQNAEARADQAADRVNAISSMIPLGQPILVGHHSERRHRKDLSRIESGMRKAAEESKKADYFSSKAGTLDYEIKRTRESRSYIGNRIEEATKEVAALLRLKDGVTNEALLGRIALKESQANEKLQYWQTQLSELEASIVANGGQVASPETVKVGDEIYFHGWLPVVRVNRKTVTVSNWLGIASFTYKIEYRKISKFRSPGEK